ncbi:endoglucanase 24 [Tanacetum coccineum]
MGKRISSVCTKELVKPVESTNQAKTPRVSRVIHILRMLHIKISFTVLAWGVVEFGDMMPPAELRNALVAIRWSTEYLLQLVVQLKTMTAGKGQRTWTQMGQYTQCMHQDMDTDRTVYIVHAPDAASDVAGEMAEALAALSIAFRPSDP